MAESRGQGRAALVRSSTWRTGHAFAAQLGLVVLHFLGGGPAGALSRRAPCAPRPEVPADRGDARLPPQAGDVALAKSCRRCERVVSGPTPAVSSHVSGRGYDGVGEPAWRFS